MAVISCYKIPFGTNIEAFVYSTTTNTVVEYNAQGVKGKTRTIEDNKKFRFARK